MWRSGRVTRDCLRTASVPPSLRRPRAPSSSSSGYTRLVGFLGFAALAFAALSFASSSSLDSAGSGSAASASATSAASASTPALPFFAKKDPFFLAGFFAGGCGGDGACAGARQKEAVVDGGRGALGWGGVGRQRQRQRQRQAIVVRRPDVRPHCIPRGSSDCRNSLAESCGLPKRSPPSRPQSHCARRRGGGVEARRRGGGVEAARRGGGEAGRPWLPGRPGTRGGEAARRRLRRGDSPAPRGGVGSLVRGKQGILRGGSSHIVCTYPSASGMLLLMPRH